MKPACPIEFHAEGWSYSLPGPQKEAVNKTLEVSVFQEKGIWGVVAYIFQGLAFVFSCGLIDSPEWTTVHHQKVEIEQYESPEGTREIDSADAELLLRRAHVEEITAQKIERLKDANKYTTPFEGRTHRENPMYRIVKRYYDGELTSVSLLLYSKSMEHGKRNKRIARKLIGAVERIEITSNSEKGLAKALSGSGVAFDASKEDGLPMEVAKAATKGFKPGTMIDAESLVEVSKFLGRRRLCFGQMGKLRIVNDEHNQKVGFSFELGKIGRSCFDLTKEYQGFLRAYAPQKDMALRFEVDRNGIVVLNILRKDIMQKRVHEALKNGEPVGVGAMEISNEIKEELRLDGFLAGFAFNELFVGRLEGDPAIFEGISPIIAKTHYSKEGKKLAVSFNLGPQSEAVRVEIEAKLNARVVDEISETQEIVTTVDGEGNYLVMIQHKEKLDVQASPSEALDSQVVEKKRPKKKKRDLKIPSADQVWAGWEKEAAENKQRSGEQAERQRALDLAVQDDIREYLQRKQAAEAAERERGSAPVEALEELHGSPSSTVVVVDRSPVETHDSGIDGASSSIPSPIREEEVVSRAIPPIEEKETAAPKAKKKVRSKRAVVAKPSVKPEETAKKVARVKRVAEIDATPPTRGASQKQRPASDAIRDVNRAFAGAVLGTAGETY